MSRLLPALALTAVLSLTACAGGGTVGSASVGPAEPAGSPSAASTDAGSAGACASSTETGTVQAAMTGNAFSPGTIEAKVGDVITWTNGDGAPHTATYKDDPTCTTENLTKGESGSLTFSAAGTYAFFCKVHPDMTGTIEVTS